MLCSLSTLTRRSRVALQGALGASRLASASAAALAMTLLVAAPTTALGAPDTPSAAVATSATVLPAAPAAPAQVSAGNDAIMGLLGERGLMRPLNASVTMVQNLRDSVRDTASDLVMSAMNFLGVPYKLGGNSESTGFDCSGFTRHIFENSLGLVLPRRAEEQASSAALLPIGRSELKPGDLVFFNTMKRTFSHVGIYLGDDKFIHAPRTGSEVRIEDMRLSYWSQRFTGARRADLSAASPQLTTPR